MSETNNKKAIQSRFLAVEKVSRIACLAWVASVGCNGKVDSVKEPEAKPQPTEEVKPVETVRRNLKVKESIVLVALNAPIAGRQQFNFGFATKNDNNRFYADAKNKVVVLFGGDVDNLASVTVAADTAFLLDEANVVANVKTFLNVANRMVLGVAPSVVEQSDGWLDNHLVNAFTAKDPQSIVLGGYAFILTRTPDSSQVYYSIFSAD